MKKLIFLSLFLCSCVDAGLPPTTSKASGDSTNITTFNFQLPNFSVTHTGVTAQFNLLNTTGGGTGVSNPTAHQVPVAEGSSNFVFVSPSTSGFVLTSNGTGSDPSFQAPTSGIVYDWAGFHDSTCSWSTTSATFVTPSGDSTCVFNTRNNSNFGTVTSTVDGSAHDTPGFSWTPPVTGDYFVCATLTGFNSLVNRCFVLLTDGTAAISSGIVTGSNQPQGFSFCGIQHITSTSATQTIIQMATEGGTFTVTPGSGLVTAIEWAIHLIH